MMLTRPSFRAVCATLRTPPGSVAGSPPHHPTSKITSTLQPRSPAGIEGSSIPESPLYQRTPARETFEGAASAERRALAREASRRMPSMAGAAVRSFVAPLPRRRRRPKALETGRAACWPGRALPLSVRFKMLMTFLGARDARRPAPPGGKVRGSPVGGGSRVRQEERDARPSGWDGVLLQRIFGEWPNRRLGFSGDAAVPRAEMPDRRAQHFR